MQTVRRPSAARLYLFLFAVALPLACAGAQQVRQAPPAVLNLFDVAAGTLQSLTVVGDGSGDLVVPVVIGGARRSMVLSLHDVRAPDFQLFERTAAGLVPLPTPPCVTYRGHLAEEPSARVAATVIDGTVEAMIYRASTAAGVAPETWVVQPLRRVRPGASAALHVVFRATDTNPLPYQCGTDTSAVTPSTSTAMPDSTSICEIAIEADRQFWQWHNNNTVQTQNDVTNVMNQVDFIFDRDCDVTFVITSLIVTTTTVYTTNDSSALLNQFANFWTANNGAIHRDVAHLFTGRNLTGSTIGVAYLSTVCSQSNGYGLSQSDFTSNFNSRVGLTCHELGHNFSAPHCNGNNPCYIMCSGLGGCSNNVTLFGPTAAAQIANFASSAACMPPPPTVPVLSSVSPGSVTVFAPGAVTLTGSGFYDVTSYTVGGQVLTTGMTILSDTAMAVTMPPTVTLGPTTVSVTGSLGTSNALAVDYVVTQPPKLRSTTLVPATGGIATFDFGGTPNNLWFLVLGIFPTTTPFQGFDLLSNPLLLNNGVFSGPLGIESFSVPVPGGLGQLQFYLQLLEGDTNGMATGVSNLSVTILL